MKTSNLILVAGALCLGGCASRPSTVITQGERVYLTTFGPATEAVSIHSTNFRLGAGDALGEAVFARYVAFVRATMADPQGEAYAHAQTPIITLD